MENTLSISEHTWNDGGTDCEDSGGPDAASLAVGVVVEGARKGVVALCASVAHIIREKNRLEERLKELESKIYIGNNVRSRSPNSCTVTSHMSLSTESKSLPESPSALRQSCGSTLSNCINSNIHVASANKNMRYLNQERKKYVTQGFREHPGNNSFVNDDRNRNVCVCKENNKSKIVDEIENDECIINDKRFKSSSSKINLINSKNCEIDYPERDFSMCVEKNVKSSPGSETSYEYTLPKNNHITGLRATRSYSGSHRTSPQFLQTPDQGYVGNSGRFHRNSNSWSTRSLNLGANLPRDSFMRRKYSTISLRRVKRSLPSKEVHSSSSVGLTRSVSSSRGSSVDVGSRRSSDLANTAGGSSKKVGGIYPSQQPQPSGCDNFTNRSTSSGSNSSRSYILTAAEVHHEPETNNNAHYNTEREAVKLLARTLTTILRDQSEAQELGEISSTASNYVHNTKENSHLDYSKQSPTSTSLDTSKITVCLNQKDSLVSSPTSEFDDIKNEECDMTFDVPYRRATNPISEVPEFFQNSSDAQSRASDTFEISYGQDTVDATEDNFPCNQEIKAPFPLAGCECPICERLSSNPNAKLFALTTDEGFLLPRGSAVLVHGDYVGTVLYMGHHRTTVAGMLLHHSGYCSNSNSAGQVLESCDTCEITDANVHAFTTQLAPIGVMCSLWNEERQETFVPLSAVICQLDEDTLINSQNSSCGIKSSSHLTLSEYEDVESGDEDISYNSYRITNGDNNSVVSERSDIVEEEDNVEYIKENENKKDNIGKLLFTTTTECCEKWKQSEIYPSPGKDISQRSSLDFKEDKHIQDDTNSIDNLSLYGLDYNDDDPDFTNHIESDTSLSEEFCSPNSVCDPGFQEYHNRNYLLASSTDLRKMSNSVRVTISPTNSSKSQSINAFDYPHSLQLNTTYLKEPSDHSMLHQISSDEKGESFESIDENGLESIKENSNFTKVNQQSLYDTCDSAISLSFIRRFSGRNEVGTSEVSVSSSLHESGRESGSLGDTWGSSALSYPRYRSDSSGNVSDVEMNHLSSTFTKDLTSALDSVLKKTQKEKVKREENTEYDQEFGKERSYKYNGGFSYNECISKSQMNSGSNAWKALDNRYQEDSEV